MPIPPDAWGGVESLIWNCKQELERQGHEVMIQNTWLGNNLEVDVNIIKAAISNINSWKPDFVHLHYDAYADIMPFIDAPRAMTSHYPYLDYPSKRHGYEWIFHKFAKNHSYVFSLSDRNEHHFKSFGVHEQLSYVWPGGVLSENFQFSTNPSKVDRAICLGKVEPRKLQARVQKHSNLVDFAGPVADSSFSSDSNYLGVWSREQVYNDLTEYGSMVLLSDGESAPQVVMEALVTGLGLVLSEEAAANLDASLPFITIFDGNMGTLDEQISKNIEVSSKMRDEIREYGIEKFGISNAIKRYTNKINELRENA